MYEMKIDDSILNYQDINSIKIKKVRDNAIIPTHGSASAAGYDLYASSYEGFTPEDDWTLIIGAGDTIKIGTGIAIELKEGTFGGIYPRSGLATKQGLAPANKVGIIDSDYRGEIIVALYNHSKFPQVIKCGDRIAQLIIQPYYSFNLKEVEELSDTERGDGGFGSTGKN